MNKYSLFLVAGLALGLVAGSEPAPAQEVPNAALPGPLVLDTWFPGPCSPNGQAHGGCPPGERYQIRLTTVASGLTGPYHIDFLPNSTTMLVTESVGRLRIVRDDVLDARAVAGWPGAGLDAGNLNSVLVHPDFEHNGRVYLSYIKRREDSATTIALARARLVDAGDGPAELLEVADIFVADAWIVGGGIASRAAFGPDGKIYLSVSDHDPVNNTDDTRVRILAQTLDSDTGKVLRLNDDGSIPADNPFVGREDANPQVFSYGHRNVSGFAWDTQSGDFWATDIGPMGGDELNLLLPGHNYGWPLVSLGRIYNTNRVSEQPWWRPDMEMPVLHWSPAISPIGLLLYTGDRFPWWQGSLFMGALNGQTLQRVSFNQPLPQTVRLESMLTELDSRIRFVAQGPDGLLYIAAVKRPGGIRQPVSEIAGGAAILRIEPAD